MKLTIIRNFLILALVATFVNLGTAQAQNIAVVDLENVLKNSKAMKDAQKKIINKQTGFQKEIDKKQADLEEESKKIEAKKALYLTTLLKLSKKNFLKKLKI